VWRICVDFDGTIAEYGGSWDDPPGDPIPYAREFLTALAEFAEVVILTARDPAAVRAWLRQHHFPLLHVTNVKPPAMAYIDDRAVRFQGRWDADLLRQVLADPWWAKERTTIAEPS